MQSISVSTTQNVSIQYPLASLGDRIIAYLIDQLIIVFYCIVSFIAIFNLARNIWWIYILIIVLPMILYSLVFEIIMNGQTPGKKAVKIQVLKVDGTEAGFGEYVLRWIFAIIDIGFSSGALAVLMIALGGKGQRIGDVVAGTTVVKLIEEKEITSEKIFITPDDSYQPYFVEAASLLPRDIELIQKAIEMNDNFDNESPMMMVSEKVKTLLGIRTNMPAKEFLYTIVKDYNHLNSI
jgi:uncharacterized RDD family membrane protein YckC